MNTTYNHFIIRSELVTLVKIIYLKAVTNLCRLVNYDFRILKIKYAYYLVSLLVHINRTPVLVFTGGIVLPSNWVEEVR